jgi:hypothetical protein
MRTPSSARTRDNLIRARELAGWLADDAHVVAEIAERSARLHDDFAADPTHPLHAGAADYAAHERAVSRAELREEVRLRHIASGLDVVSAAEPVNFRRRPTP